MTEPQQPEPESPELLSDEEQRAARMEMLHQRMREPRVLVEIRARIDVGEASWTETVEDDKRLAVDEEGWWNARFKVRGGDRTITARRFGFPFNFRDANYDEFEGHPGDWLIREDGTGYVFALSAHAMEYLFEPIEEPASASAPAE